MDRNLALELVRITEAAALASSHWVGRGDKNAADDAAVTAMRDLFGTLSIRGTVVIGEGEKDQAPMLFNGEQVGDGTGPACDIAVDPIDGTTQTAQGLNNAVSVLAVAERGTMLDISSVFYMDKLVAGPEAADTVQLDAPPAMNIRAVARAKGIAVRDVTVAVLHRPRHEELVRQIRAAGARTRLLADGDVAGAILACSEGSGVDLLLGVGGSPEGIITACAVKCTGGTLQARLRPRDHVESAALIAQGHSPDTVLTADDLVRSDDVFFAATGITDGDLLHGVRHLPSGSATTASLVMRSRSGTVRNLHSRHTGAARRGRV
jgi:fructose-1,6-bisphosphatase II